jgi:hypothetical protein
MRQKDEKKRSQAVAGQAVVNNPNELSVSLLAYHFGRLLNQLSWYQLNAALFGKPEHYKQADAIWIELQRNFGGFIHLLAHDAIYRILRKFRHREFRPAWLSKLKKEIQGRMKDGSNLVDARTDELAKQDWSARKELREDVLEVLRDKYLSAFHLGEYIDGLLRPPDAFDFLDSLEELVRTKVIGPAADWFAIHYSFVDVIEPEKKWIQHLQWLWEEARIPQRFPLLPDDATLATEQLKKRVRQIADAAVEGLKALDETMSELPRPQLRLSVDIQSAIVTVDGKKPPQVSVSVAEAFFLAALIKKNGELVSFSELQQKIVQLQSAKPTLLIKSINKKLGDKFIEGKQGAGCRLTSIAWIS